MEERWMTIYKRNNSTQISRYGSGTLTISISQIGSSPCTQSDTVTAGPLASTPTIIQSGSMGINGIIPVIIPKYIYAKNLHSKKYNL